LSVGVTLPMAVTAPLVSAMLNSVCTVVAGTPTPGMLVLALTTVCPR
jgi:hypothetical protein